MEMETENLFYSKLEKIAFYIAGYIDNTNNACEMSNMLLEGAVMLSGITDEDVRDIKTMFIDESHCYKNMRVFYVTTNRKPKDANILGNSWTMMTWLHF